MSIVSDPNLPLPPVGQAAQINTSSGNAQRGLVATPLPRPLIAVVTDQAGNAVPGVLVKFTLTEGGGHLASGSTFDATTDDQGHASASYISGNNPGVQIIRANFNNNLSTPAVFSAEALESSNGSTAVTGVVLDQNLRALPNVLVRIGGQQTRSAVDGRFRVSGVPAGPHMLLELIGRDQITFAGRWPNITYDLDVLPGVDNDLGRPLFLPQVNDGIDLPLDSNNNVTQDTVYELPVIGVEESEIFELLSDGSPDAPAIRAFNTLTGKDVPNPVFWENIGSQIAFPVMFGQVGKVINQRYPTYFIYRNGQLDETRPQAPNPINHFYPNPYPFGNESCGILMFTTPGGRCGDAVSPPAPGSRVPPYVEDLLRPHP